MFPIMPDASPPVALDTPDRRSSIRDRVAVITGAASGIGRATARLLAGEGARVALLDRTRDRLEAVVEEIQREQGRATGWTLDLSDSGALRSTVEAVVRQMDGIDILVNNAGISARIAIEDEAYEDQWASTLEVNLTVQARLLRLCLPSLLRSSCARVVNIASTEGLGATSGVSPYTASKHGVIGLTRALAVELGRRKVTVNCICPGPIRTGLTAAIPEADKDKFARRRVPLGRYGEPEEIAHGVLSLVLPGASYINGAVLVIDGGMTAQNT